MNLSEEICESSSTPSEIENPAQGTLQQKDVHRENWSYLALIILLLIVSSIPFITGSLLSTDKMRFMGFIKDPWDNLGYFAYFQQVRDGHLLFSNLYTPEHTDHILFNPFFLIVGLMGIKTGLPFIYQASRLAFGFLALWLLLMLVRTSTDDVRERRFAFLLAATGGGFGWIAWMVSGFPVERQLLPIHQLCPDLWYTEAYTFLSLWNYPHFMCALSLQISIYILLLSHSRSGNAWHLAAAGALTALLASVHPFDFITIYGIFITYTIFLLALHRITIKKALQNGALFILTSIAPMLYQAWFLFFHPVLTRVWVFNLEIPGMLQLYLSYGLSAIFATVYAVVFFRNRSWKNATFTELLLFSCILFQCIIIYLPIPHARRFIQGLQIPLGILGGIALSRYLLVPLEKHSKLPAEIFALLLLIFSVSSAFVPMGASTTSLYLRKSPEFLNKNEFDALSWLADNRPSGIVLSSPFYGMWIPGLAGCQVYQGHWSMTYDIKKKRDDYRMFIRAFNNGDREAVTAFLKKWQIRCFFTLRSSIREENATLFEMTEEYRNPIISIYRCP
ncbi:MAG: hypothetical protein AB9903_28660 [Vulcanimicrobiota bacterium]